MEMRKITLGDCIIDCASGPFGSNLKVECFVEDGFPIIDGANLKGVRVTDNITKFVTEEKARSLSRSIAKRRDVIVTISGTLGQISFIPNDSKYNEYLCSQRQFRVTFDESKIDVEYLVNYLHTDFGQKKILSFANYVGVPALAQPLPNFKKIELLIPSIQNQKKVVQVLSALDDKIALNKKMNQKLEAMAKRLYDYWFVQYDFPDKNDHPYKTTGGPMTYNPTLKREIPVGWEVKTLDEYLDCNKYSLTAKSSYDFIQYLDTSSLTENTLESLQRYGSQAESPSRAKRIVYANDILYSTVRPQQKHYGIIKNPAQNMIASTGFAILSCKYGSEYNDMFYLFLIQEKNLIKLSAIADSNASSYPSFNPSDLLNLSICLPNDLKIIEPLVKRFSSLFSIIERNQKENQKLTALRDKLLPLLMNGQVVVGKII